MRYARLVRRSAWAAALLLGAAAAQAAPQGFMAVRGQRTGIIRGEVSIPGQEGTIAVLAISHSIISPRDVASGLPTGQRMHKPLVVTIEWDSSLPQLYGVLCNNENLPQVTIALPAPGAAAGAGTRGAAGTTIKLTNANIASIDARMPNAQIAENQRLGRMLEVAFTYQKIEWTDGRTGATASDDWERRQTGPAAAPSRAASARPGIRPRVASSAGAHARPAARTASAVR